MKTINLRVNIHKIILPVITIALMVFLGISDGVVWGGDTQGYLNMDIGREAGYSLFLHFFFLIFGETGFAQAVVVFQLFLWGASLLILTGTIAKLWDCLGNSGLLSVIIKICLRSWCGICQYTADRRDYISGLFPFLQNGFTAEPGIFP